MVTSYHMSPTLKTTVYLEEADYERLKGIARRQGRAPAELIREAVAQYGARKEQSTKPRSLGAGHSRRGDLSERAEELLEGFGKRK